MKSARSWKRIRPATLGQAGRIEGVTSAALTLVLAHVKGAAKRPKVPEFCLRPGGIRRRDRCFT